MKTFFAGLKMSRKLLVNPLIVVIFLLAFGMVTYVGLKGQNETIDDLFNTRFKNYQDISTIINKVTTVHANVYKVITWTQSGFDQKRTDQLAQEQLQAIDGTAGIVQKILKSNLMSQEKALYEVSITDLKAYQKMVAGVIDMASADFSAATTMMVPAETKYQNLHKNLNDLWELENRLGRERYAASASSFKNIVTLCISVLIAAVVLSLLISFLLSRIITAPISGTTGVIKDVSRGDLTRRLTVSSQDEIGEMSSHFNSFVDQLQQNMVQIAESSTTVSSAADSLNNVAEQMAGASSQVSVQVSSVAGASEEMAATSTQIAQNCARAAESSQQANKSVQAGAAIITETVHVMDEIAVGVKESAALIESLGTRSDQIGRVIELINEIADQTNLLALNAAIEAARAGEHGRGFAVVADEVRKLAERTGDATKDIGETIAAMQSETKTAVTSMVQSVEKVEAGNQKAKKSGVALDEILREINTVVEQINQIAVAAEQETATTNEMTANIHQISAIVNQMAETVQENSDEASRLSNLAGELGGIVGQFKLGSEHARFEQIN